MNSRVNFQTSAAELEEEARQNGKKGKKDKSKAADAKEADLPQEGASQGDVAEEAVKQE